MNLDDVNRGIHKHRRRKRVGRGVGSGHGKTAGRGHKGQGQLAGWTAHPAFEGGRTALFRRIPKRGFHNQFAKVVAEINVGRLEELFAEGAEVTPAALESLLAYQWPGNIRELRNCIERAVVLSNHDTIDTHDLALSQLAPAGDTGRGTGRGTGVRHGAFVPQTIEELERRHIMATLAAVGGNKTKAAAMLGIERSTLDRKLTRWAKRL